MISELKDSFCDLLRSVNRPHTEDVISELQRLGFFESPASRKDHLAFEGGLVLHCKALREILPDERSSGAIVGNIVDLAVVDM